MRYKLEKRVTSGNKTVGFVVVESPDYTRQVYIQTSNVIMLAKQGKLDNATYDKSKKRIKVYTELTLENCLMYQLVA